MITPQITRYRPEGDPHYRVAITYPGPRRPKTTPRDRFKKMELDLINPKMAAAFASLERKIK